MPTDWVPICGYGRRASIPNEATPPFVGLCYPIINPYAGLVDDTGAPSVVPASEMATFSVGAVETQRRYKVHRIVGQVFWGMNTNEDPASALGILNLTQGQFDLANEAIDTPWGTYFYGVPPPNPFTEQWVGTLPAQPLYERGVAESSAALLANDNFFWRRIYGISSDFDVEAWVQPTIHPWWTAVDIKLRKGFVPQDQPLVFEVYVGPNTAGSLLNAVFMHTLRALVST